MTYNVFGGTLNLAQLNHELMAGPMSDEKMQLIDLQVTTLVKLFTRSDISQRESGRAGPRADGRTDVRRDDAAHRHAGNDLSQVVHTVTHLCHQAVQVVRQKC